MKVKNVEKKIWDVEGFDIEIQYEDGRDVRGDRQDLPSYGYSQQAKHNWTVAEWLDKRFKDEYPGFTAEVLDADGESVPGHTNLSTVRDTYLEE